MASVMSDPSNRSELSQTPKTVAKPASKRRPATHAPATHAPATHANERRPGPAKAVGAYVPGLTEKAFTKFGFSTVALISDWRRIAGPLASHTSPERLKWPRPVQKFAEVELGCEGRPGATLVLRVEPARALDIQYGSAQLIDRINGYFGYRAVEKIRIIQAPLVAASAAPQVKLTEQPAAATVGARTLSRDRGRGPAKSIQSDRSGSLARPGVTAKTRSPALDDALQRLQSSLPAAAKPSLPKAA